jgi:dienelactone hydrolase
MCTNTLIHYTIHTYIHIHLYKSIPLYLFTPLQDGAAFGPYMSQFTYEGCLDAKIAATAAYLQGQGCETIGILAFCWGGWVAVHAIKTPPTPFTCAAIAHPSVSGI